MGRFNFKWHFQYGDQRGTKQKEGHGKRKKNFFPVRFAYVIILGI